MALDVLSVLLTRLTQKQTKWSKLGRPSVKPAARSELALVPSSAVASSDTVVVPHKVGNGVTILGGQVKSWLPLPTEVGSLRHEEVP